MFLTCLSALHSDLLHVPMCLHAFMFHMSVSFTCLSYVICNFSCLLLYIDIFSNLKLSLFILDTNLILGSKVKQNFLRIINNKKNKLFHLKNVFTTQDYLLFKVLFLSKWKCSLSLLFRCSYKKYISKAKVFIHRFTNL